ncbi:MAG TPA: dihydropteroate synthase [Egibacteraceae bacterium]|nr:dihydropteroate synthase [Egibacteraceae bacterium]
MRPLVRVVDAGLGAGAHVRVVVSRVSDPARLRSTWASSGATVEDVGGRLHATTTVEALARAAGRTFEADEAGALDRSLREAVAAWAGPAREVPLPKGALPTGRRPLVMGVVNVTPDSFSDGGKLYGSGRPHPDTARDHARRLLTEGADVIDVGGESTRPGAQPVSEHEELQRVLPVIESLDGGAVVSIDTTKPAVARAAVNAGAVIVNDVSGATNPELLEVVADTGAAYVLMHARGAPRDMQSRARYDDVVAEVYEYLTDGLLRCAEAGIYTQRILVDPGLGFAKTAEHNVALLRALRQFRGLGRPVVIGASRKSFLGELLDGADAAGRLEASLACAVVAVEAGASVIRAHDVAPTVRATRVAQAISRRVDDWR